MMIFMHHCGNKTKRFVKNIDSKKAERRSDLGRTKMRFAGNDFAVFRKSEGDVADFATRFL